MAVMAARRSLARLASVRRGGACTTAPSAATNCSPQRGVQSLRSSLTLYGVDADANGVDVRRRPSRTPADARAKLVPMSLLSPPTDEMLAAARALIHKQDQPPVGDQLLRLAIEQIKSDLTEYEIQVCEGIDSEPAHAQEALELALAQRISSTRLALDGGEDELTNPADEQPVPAPPASRHRSRGR